MFDLVGITISLKNMSKYLFGAFVLGGQMLAFVEGS